MAQTDFTPSPASHLQRDNAELIAACAVPLVEQLARIPRDAILRWTDEDGLQASHSVPIGLLAHEAASRLESLSPQPPAETGDDDADAEWLNAYADQHVTCAGHEQQIRRIASRLSVSTGDDELVARLWDAVERCRDKFAEYAELHRRKLSSALTAMQKREVLEKVERNKEMADLCIEALSRKGRGE